MKHVISDIDDCLNKYEISLILLNSNFEKTFITISEVLLNKCEHFVKLLKLVFFLILIVFNELHP